MSLLNKDIVHNVWVSISWFQAFDIKLNIIELNYNLYYNFFNWHFIIFYYF